MLDKGSIMLSIILTLLMMLALLPVPASSQGMGNTMLFAQRPRHVGLINQARYDAPWMIGKGMEPKTTVIDADFQQPYPGTVNRTSQMLFIYSYNMTNVTTAVRMNVKCDSLATDAYPVMFVARQQETILSWKVPLDIIDGYSYWAASRTLCPLDDSHDRKDGGEHFIYMGVSTMSEHNVGFELMAQRLSNFVVEHEKPRTEVVSTSRPVYFMYTFPDGVDAVLLRVTSHDKVCMTVSVQGIKCPVMDLDYNIEYQGKYQTMSTQATMYIQRQEFSDSGGFYLVFVVKPNNKACSGEIEAPKILPPGDIRDRKKIFTMEIKDTISDRQYVIATVVVVVVFLGFYIAAAFIGYLYTRCGWSKGLDDLTDLERDILSFGESVGHFPSETETDSEYSSVMQRPEDSEDGLLPAQSSHGNYGTLSEANISLMQESASQQNPTTASVPGSPSLDENDIDFLGDAFKEKDIIRTKTALYVSDLSHKRHSRQTKANNLYTWNLLTIAIFYALPAIQLVITYHENLNESGNQDLCYYNFACAHPAQHYLTSFNNVFSNIGYVMLGFLFILIVYRRNRLHKALKEKHGEIEDKFGIPQFFGLYYAMGFALMMEGIMSASYHVCPNNSNFQFDTSFMYIIACLCMLKIYQTRHPDVNARAHTVYFSMAVIILVAVCGVIYGTNILWIFYALIHMFFTFVITAQIYFVGRWKIDRTIFKKIMLFILIDCRHCSKPIYPNRFVLLFIANAINWAFALYGAILHPSDFASFLLGIFIGNLLIYCIFYIVMKIFSRERLSIFVICLILISSLTWAGSLYFFFQHLTTWADTPAGSREGNRDCILMSFYDAHDIWHFLSAVSLFLSFLILFMLDEDLKLKPRNKIPVF